MIEIEIDRVVDRSMEIGFEGLAVDVLLVVGQQHADATALRVPGPTLLPPSETDLSIDLSISPSPLDRFNTRIL